MKAQPPRTQAFVAIPGMVAVIDSVVAGAIAGIAGLGLDLGTAGAIVVGVASFLVSLACFVAPGRRGSSPGTGERWNPCSRLRPESGDEETWAAQRTSGSSCRAGAQFGVHW
jgi:hypothetical protein